MNIFDPHITGSLSVSASAHIEGDLTVLGTIRGVAELTGEVGSAISASHAASYLLTSSFEGVSGSFAITGSNNFKGDQTISGSLLPEGTLVHNIGSDSQRWNDLYLAGNTIDIGGTKISKTDGGDVELKDSSNVLKKLIASEIQIGSGPNAKTLKVSNGRFKLTTGLEELEEGLAQLSGAFTGSFSGDGSQLTNVPASGVTGLSLDSISSGSNSLAMGVTTLVSNVSILPNITDTIDLGSPDKQWRDLFLSSGSLYINGQQVLSSTGNELRITTDTGESIKIIETSTDTITLQTEDGDITLTSSGNGNIELDAPIQIGAGNKILSSDGNEIQFGNGLSITGSIVLSGTVDGVDVAGLKTNVDAILSGSNANYDTFAEIVTLINSVDTSNDESFASHYTASNSRFNSIEITTSSFDGRIDSLETFTGSVDGTIRSDLNTYTSSNDGRLVSIESQTGSYLINSDLSTLEGQVSSLETETGSINTKLSSIETTTGSLKGRISSLETESGSVDGRLDSLETETGSINTKLSSINITTGSLKARITSLETTTSSLDGRLDSVEITTGSLKGRIGSLESFTASIDDTYASDSDVTTLRTDLNTYTSSTDGAINIESLRINSLEEFAANIDDTYASDSDVTTLRGDLNTYTSSNNNKIGSLETTTGSLKGRVDSIESFTASINNTYATDQDVTTLRTDLNAYTSSNDTTNTNQGLRLDTLEMESGSIRGTLNTFTSSINSTIKSKLNVETVVSGSRQIDVTGTTNYNLITDRLDSVETFTGSIDDQVRLDLNAYTSSNNTNITTLNTFKTSVDGGLQFTGSNVTIKGNLLVKGTETRVNSTTVDLNDNIISLNGTGASDAGIEVRDVTSPGILSGSLLWDGLNNFWKGGTKGNEERLLKNSDLTILDGRLDSIEITTGSLDGRLDSVESKTGSYLTSYINTVLTGGTFNTVNGIITLTKSDGNTVSVDIDGKYSDSGHTHTFASLTSKPTTLSGYGITDAATSAQGTKADTAFGWGDHSIEGYIKSFTNTNEFVSGVTFNTSDGVLTFTRNNGGDTFTVDIDGRHVLKGGDTMTGTLIVPKLQIGNTKFSSSGDQNHVHFVGTALIPNTLTTSDNSMLGTSSYRWIGIYGGIGNFSGTVTGNSFVKVGGTSSQFLKADGSVDSSTYLTAHPSVVASASSNNSGRTYIQDILLDGFGHITGLTTATETVVNTDTNEFVSGVTFNNSNGVLTFTRNNGGDTFTVDIDGKYSELNHVHTFASLTSKPTTLGGYGITDAATSEQGTKADTAFGWGNHASVGYLTSYTEVDTLESVVNRGQTSSRALVVTSVDSGNPTAEPNSLRLSGYGVLGNRGTLYITNGAGSVQIGIGATHNTTPKATFGTTITHHGNTTIEGTLIASGYNDGNWNTAYGWGNHSIVGYLTAHPSVVASASSNNSGRTYIQDILLDGFGHITGITTATETVVNTDTNYFVTGHTWNSTTGILTTTLNNGSTTNVNLVNTLSDVTVTGGTYSSGTQILTLTKNDGKTVNVSGFAIDTDVNWYTTGSTFNSTNGVLTFTRNDGGTFIVDLDGKYSDSDHTHTFASLTSKPTTLSGYGITDAATSAQGTKADTAFGWGNHASAGYISSFTDTNEFVTGATFNSGNGVITFTRNNGGDTFTVDIDGRFLDTRAQVHSELFSTGGDANDYREFGIYRNYASNGPIGSHNTILHVSQTDGNYGFQLGGSTTVNNDGLYFRNFAGTNTITGTTWYQVATRDWVGDQNYVTTTGYNNGNWDTAYGWGNHAGLYSLLNHTHTFASLTSKPTTLSGYGITDAATSAQGTKADTAFGWGNHASGGYLSTSGKAADSELLDGYNSSTSPTANTVVVRNANGDIAAREIILSSALITATPTVLVSMYPGTNQLVRTTPEAVATSLNLSGTNTGDQDLSGYLSTSGKAADSNLLDGLDLHTGRNNEANKVVRTDVNGYLQSGWINTTSGDNGTTAISRIYASQDGYIRYYTPTNFINNLGLVTTSGYNNTNWNTAYGWGNHASAGYSLTSHNHDGNYLKLNPRLNANADTITTSGIHIWDVSNATDDPSGAGDGLLTTKYWDSTNWAVQSYHDFHSNNLYIRSKQNNVWQTSWSEVFTTDNFTDSSGNWNTAYGWGNHASVGYITGFTDTNEFVTGATFNSGTGVVTFTRNNGGDIFTLNLAATLTDVTVTGGTYTAGTQTLRLTKSNGSTVDVSGFAIDTDVNWYTTSATFNTGNGIITGSHQGGTWTVDIDGRYAYSSHNHDGTYMKTNRTLTSINTIDNGGDRYEPSVNNPTNEHYAVLTYGNGGNVTGQLATHFITGDLYSRGYNSTWSGWQKYWSTMDFSQSSIGNWNTAYGWGNHANTYSLLNHTHPYLPLAGGTMSGELLGYVSTSNTDGQNNLPFRLSQDYNSYMVATANNTWGLFWAGGLGAKYGTNGVGGPGDIWGNSANPNEFVFVGSDSTKWTLHGNSGNTWQLGTISASNFSGTHSGTSSGTNTGDQTLPTASSLGAVTITGNQTITGLKSFAGAIRITETGTAQHILIGNQDSAGTDKPSMIMGVNGQLKFGYGNSWVGEGGTFTPTLTLDASGNSIFSGTVGATNLSGTNTGDQTNISGNAATATYATTAGSAPNDSNLNSVYGVSAGDGRGLKFWNGSDNYKIGMGNADEYHYGPVTDYSIKMVMDSNNSTRGFTWGVNGGTPIAGLNVGNGNMQIAGTFTASGYNDGNWNTAYGWGNHSGLYSLTSHNHDDRYFQDNKGSISLTGSNPFDDSKTETQVTGSGSYVINYTGASAHLFSSNVGGSASMFQIGAHYNGSDFYMRTRTDSTSWNSWKQLWHSGDFSSTNISNWNTAYGWGNHANTYSLLNHTHTFASLTSKPTTVSGYGITDMGSQSVSSATTATNLGADYTADDWFRATGDNNPVKFYGGSTQMTFRTDGATEAYSGVGAYPFVWSYGGSSSTERIMLLATTGRIWSKVHGWLDEAFSTLNHTHTFASLTSKPTTLSGYGITDAASSTHTHTFASLTSKPTTLSGYGITDAASSANVSNWNTAYGWGNHASAGYIVKGSEIASSSAWTTATKFGSVGELSGAAGNHALSVRSELGNDAFMSFHIGSDYAIHFGLDGASNRLHVGGWSDGTGTQYQMYDSRDGSASNWNTAYGWGNHASGGYATQTYVGEQIGLLVDSAPGTLDTLNELAAALGDDPNFATTITTSIGNKLPLAGGTMSGDIIFNNNIRLEYSTTHWITPRDTSGNMHLHTATGGIYLDAPVIYFRERGSESNKITIDNGTLTATGTISASNFSGTHSGTSSGTNTGDQTNISGNAATATEAQNNYFYVRGTSPTIQFVDTDQGQSRYVHHNGGGIGFLDAGGSWSLRCGDGSAQFYGTVSATNLSGTNTGDQTNISGNAATATYATTAGSAPNGSNANQFYNVSSGDGNGLRLWDGQDGYKISMGNSSVYHYGPVTDYSIKTQMNGTAGRGFTWGTNGSVPIAGLNSVNGDMQIAGTFKSTGLTVEGTISGSTVFDVQGTQGQLFSITDDLTGDIFTVSDISGMPILSVNSLGVVTIDDTLRVTGDVIAYAASDSRLKENITPIENAIDKIKLIGGYEFDWNDLSKNSGHDVGVIAQEIEEVLPELVSTRGDGFKGVKYDKLTALLIQANKELIKRVEELESKLNK